MEKHLLRSAFEGWLPDDVLWRSKEGFSEAMGSTDLGTVLEEHAAQLVTDDQFAHRATLFPWKTPQTKVPLFPFPYLLQKRGPHMTVEIQQTLGMCIPYGLFIL
jgi:asparagine synthetase B (glutamine-hydrolysing)